jgi:hypothetical protein
MRATLAALLFAFLPVFVFAQLQDDQVPLSFALSANPHSISSDSIATGGGVLGRQSNGSLLGIDSLPNWSSYFYLPGVIDNFGSMQFTWQYTMVGHAPFGARGHGDDDWDGGTTKIGAPIIPVNIDLRNFDGSPRFLNGVRLYSDATRYVNPVLKSPVFANSSYSSSEGPTQFTDAVQRAEFFHQADDDWHTLLKPRVGTPRTMVLIRGTYRFATNSDGTLAVVFVDANTFFSKLFPPTSTGNDTTTVIGLAETSGDIRTKDTATFLFPDTYLYLGGNPKNCCILGFHTYDLESGSAANGWQEKRYVLNYSSWISPGIFGGGFQDVTALSHELSETFNDPFVNNAVPWWLAPNGNCQNNLETGDVIEGLANAVDPITLNGFTYHPQNEALLQWFADQTPSRAIHGAYSYPNEAVLPTGSTPQLPGCPAH